MGRVTEATTSRVEAGVEVETHGGAVMSGIGQPDVSQQTPLGATDVKAGAAECASNIGQAEAASQPGVAQLGSEFNLEPSTRYKCLFNRACSVWHLRMVAVASLPSRYPGLRD